MLRSTLATALALGALMAGPALADHANPWATPEDTVLSQFHDDNQARSVGTPGEDEMRGAMVRSARGKLDTDLAAARGDGGSRGGAGGGDRGNDAGRGGSGDGNGGGRGAGGGNGHGRGGN
jgi:hypothetical protein